MGYFGAVDERGEGRRAPDLKVTDDARVAGSLDNDYGNKTCESGVGGWVGGRDKGCVRGWGARPFPFQADCKGAGEGLLDELEDPQNLLEFRPRARVRVS